MIYNNLLNCSVSLVFILSANLAYVQNQKPNTDLLPRGPRNILPNGVVDGIAIKDEVPLRREIEYEFVRSSDLVWSKRVFSRIDAREKINHELFFPNDKFLASFTELPPKKIEDIVNHKGWIRNQERLSLWTIIMQHLMNGDLPLYRFCDKDDYNFSKEDGYSFKYPVIGQNPNITNKYFNDPAYKKEIDEHIGIFEAGSVWYFDNYAGQKNVPIETNPTITDFNKWTASLISNDYDPNSTPGWKSEVEILKQLEGPQFEASWKASMDSTKITGKPSYLYRPSKTRFLNSEMIVAYNIKEDWYFDKERSLLERRIIAIAPVAKHLIDNNKVSKRGGKLFINPEDGLVYCQTVANGKASQFAGQATADYELFWLYFPDLRRVMVNYYIYNDQNDSQWMSFDDMFWKRRFNAQIYRVSDKFDREIEDYKFGVDALYEAERIKEQIREWEINVWNY